MARNIITEQNDRDETYALHHSPGATCLLGEVIAEEAQSPKGSPTPQVPLVWSVADATARSARWRRGNGT
uniref:Uncharacterized protein n=1 Tax=Aegilops tauschii subsp. strangulata TaxID=200361 RepID=A0A453JN18_AEGTS